MKKEIKIALVAIAGIIVLFFGMNFLKGISLFSEKNVYYASFSNISGLTVSNPIFANGYQVGIVRDIAFDYSGGGDIVVAFTLDDKMQLPQGTTASIESDFMGNVRMNLLLSSHNTPLPTGEGLGGGALSPSDTIQGAMAEGLMARAAALIPAVEQMLPKVDSILASVNALLADPAIAHSIRNVEKVSTDLTTTTRQVNALMTRLNSQLPTLMTKTDGVLDNAQQLTKNLTTLDIDGTMQKVDQTLANVQAVSEKLNKPDGTLGLLMNDATLYDRFNGTLTNAEQLLGDIKEHPKRYINISVFGKKDKGQ
ncbi:MAG: MCE family protein [Bacteroidaceae bacterium]|nr:MCE family protein [Bacteroidaceae bacterium]